MNKHTIKKLIPIQRVELTKFLCTAVLIFAIAYIHSILHISKDVLVISHLGTESISAIKIWAVLPISLIFMFLYIKLSDKLSRAQLFYITTWFFISYFILFALVLYPHRETLIIDISNPIVSRLSSFKYLFRIVSNWHYTLFYVFSEGWVVIMFSISFWQTANHITSIEESKRFYPLFGTFAGLGKMIAGILSTNYAAKYAADWQSTLNNITISIVIAGIIITICLFFLEKIIGVNTFNLKRGHFKSKNKISFKESLKYISSSKVMLLITSLLLCYNISLNIVEGVWKKSIEIFFTSNANYIQHFISKIDICISIVSITSTFIGAHVLRLLKWKIAALITPIIILLTGGIFFLSILFREITWLLTLQSSIIIVAVYLGAVYNVCSRSLKHAIFDPTKEMIYIPLDDDLKTKGKAAAEIVGMRFGKGSGAFLQQGLFALFPALTLLDLSPIIFTIFIIISLGWFYSIFALNRLATKLK
ncbi:MAG: NTP/NDP exchange transporter [Coxiellaceae bacterium]|jgi:AAA family ATP:ADP antiporter|nr:NTP/NDP exchange transporter [Coxiellaceae bacterium]